MCESVVLCRRSPPNHPPPPKLPLSQNLLTCTTIQTQHSRHLHIYTPLSALELVTCAVSVCICVCLVVVRWQLLSPHSLSLSLSLPSSLPLDNQPCTPEHIPVYNIAWVFVVSDLFVFEWCQISVLPSLPIMAFKNGLSERLDELRFPSPRSPTSESPFPGYTSLSPGQPNLASAFSSRPSGDVRANLQRRFTTDSSKLSSWSYLNQQPSGPPQVSDPLDLLSSVGLDTFLFSSPISCS